MEETALQIYTKYFKESIKGLCLEINKSYKELEKYKSIEEELGCPLLVLVEALKNGIWTYQYWDCEKEENKDKLKLIQPSLYFEPSLEIDKFMFDCGDHGYYSEKLKDYKKTWWLKEDKSE